MSTQDLERLAGPAEGRACYAITVEFQVRPEAYGAFLELVRRNAATSVAVEPECLRFDVLAPAKGAATIFLYEIYSDRAAFEAHLASEHFLSFDRSASGLVLSKTVLEYAVWANGKG